MRQDKLRTLKFGAPATAPLYFHPRAGGLPPLFARLHTRRRKNKKKENGEYTLRSQNRGNRVHGNYSAYSPLASAPRKTFPLLSLGYNGARLVKLGKIVWSFVDHSVTGRRSLLRRFPRVCIYCCSATFWGCLRLTCDQVCDGFGGEVGRLRGEERDGRDETIL